MPSYKVASLGTPNPSEQRRVASEAEIERQRELAQSFASQAANTQKIANPLQGVNYVAQNVLSGLFDRKAEKSETARRDAMAEALTAAIGDTSEFGISSENMRILNSLDPENFGAKILGAKMEKAMNPEEKWVSETLPNGAVVQKSSKTGKQDVLFEPGDGGAFAGNGMDAQSWNIILKGDPMSPEYGAAYNHLFQTPKMVNGVDSEGRQIVTPIMPTVPQGVEPPGGSAAPQAEGAGLPAGQPAATGAPQPGQPIVTGQKPLPEQQRNRIANVGQAADTIGRELDRFVELVDKSGIEALPGADKDNLNAVRQNIMLQLKELFNLGVLNGPDLALMERMVFDPTIDVTKEGGVANLPGQVATAVLGDTTARARNSADELRRMMQSIKDGVNKQAGIATPAAPPAPLAPPAAPAKPVTEMSDEELEAIINGQH